MRAEALAACELRDLWSGPDNNQDLVVSQHLSPRNTGQCPLNVHRCAQIPCAPNPQSTLLTTDSMDSKIHLRCHHPCSA